MSSWLPSLITKTPDDSYELAVKMSRVTIKLAQPDAAANGYWR